MKCWIIWCAHQLVRLLLPHIYMYTSKYAQSTHTESRSFSHSHTSTWSYFAWSKLTFYLNLLAYFIDKYNISNHSEHMHTDHILTLLSPHPCSTKPTKPTHLLVPPTALDVLARVFPIKHFIMSPLLWVGFSKWLSSAVQHGRHSIQALARLHQDKST